MGLMVSFDCEPTVDVHSVEVETRLVCGVPRTSVVVRGDSPAFRAVIGKLSIAKLHLIVIHHATLMSQFCARLDEINSMVDGEFVVKFYAVSFDPDYGDSLGMLRAVIPALVEWHGCAPCKCRHIAPLADLIIHLNDREKWSRERIADWLDTLDLDLSFPVPDTIPENIN